MDEKCIPIVPLNVLVFPDIMEIEDRIRDIINRYSALIRSVIITHIHAGDALDPQDIEQEIRIKIWKSIRKGINIDKLPSYIKKVAYTATIDELRRLRKQAPYRSTFDWGRMLILVQEGLSDSNGENPERGYDRLESELAIAPLLEKLSQDRKRVLQLYACGLSVDEICECFNWDRTRVRHLLYRGIDDLKRLSKGSRPLKKAEKKDRHKMLNNISVERD